MGVLVSAVSRFVEPSPALSGVEDRERARLLSGVLLVIVLFGAATTVLQLVLVPGFFPETFFRVAGALTVLSAAWALSRTRHFRVAAWVAVAVPQAVTLVQGSTHPDDVSWWAFLLISPLFATMFFATRVAAVVAGLAALGAAVVLVSSRTQLPTHNWVAPIAFHLIYAPLLITAAWHRQVIERKRQAELLARDAALAEARRLEAIGRLAGGIAHDFNNLLTVVLANAQLICDGAPGSDARTRAEEITQAADRAAALTHQLLAFAKQQPRTPEPLDVGALVRGLEPMIRRLVGSAITLAVRLPSTPAIVVADATQLDQVVMNLVANAREAMPQGGTLTVEVSTTPTNVLLTVRDTGVGLDDATRDRIFEPFFTTRAGRGGTGLGLATTHSIVEQCGGSIRVASAPGKGAEFQVTLPVSSASPVAPAHARRPAAVALSARVLLVDDEAGILRALQQHLTSAGVQVTVANSGAEALALAAQHPFDTLITDVSMPGMQGTALAARLREKAPELPIVFITGHSEGADLTAMPRSVVLSKPVKLEALLGGLSRLLASRGAP
ncbi:MAG: ATP-binding protein [Myxococcota bacterium]